MNNMSLTFGLCAICMATMLGISTAPKALAATTQEASSDGKVESNTEDLANDISLEIKIETSRPQPQVGSNLGITAELTNKSRKSVLYLSEQSTTLTLPPEMEGRSEPLQARYSFFPTESKPAQQKKVESAPDWPNPVIAIRPGHSYRAAWVQKPVPNQNFLQQIRDELRYIFFLPGDYKVVVNAKVGVDKSPLVDGYYTFSEVATVRASAPQFVLIFGAVIGGLISWLLFPQGQDKVLSVTALSPAGVWAATKKLGWYAYSMGGACLLSAIVTILLARLSESQFLVKINVTDFWGAVAVGFLAQYFGKTVLDKIIPGRPASQKGATQGATPNPPAP